MGITRQYPKKIDEVINEDATTIAIWEHPNTEDLLKKCGLEPIGIYVARRVKTAIPETYDGCATGLDWHKFEEHCWIDLRATAVDRIDGQTIFRAPLTIQCR
jgi:hypothetical protein